MSQETNFYEWISPRLRKLIFNTNVDFDGYIYLWVDYIRGVKITNNYCVYQMEGLHNKNIFTPEYKKFLDNAAYVFDYSLYNLRFYPRAIFLPLKFERIPEINKVDNNDILFYGKLSERRESFIKKLQSNNIPIKISKFDIYGKNLVNALKKHKFVLSFGKNNNIYNDSFRIIPAIENGCVIICEETEEVWFNRYLKEECSDRVIFFTEDNITTIKKFK